MTIDSINTVICTAIFLLPGFLIKGIVDSLTPPTRVSQGIYLLHFFTYSVVNCSVWSWLYIMLYNHYADDKVLFLLWSFVITLLGSCLLGVVIGIAKKNFLLHKFLTLFTKSLFLPIPTAWDYVFSRDCKEWLIVRLKSGHTVYGKFSGKSFVSSDPDDRDIYLEQVYVPDSDGKWIKCGKAEGIYINSTVIETIEFLEGKNNGEKQGLSAFKGR